MILILEALQIPYSQEIIISFHKKDYLLPSKQSPMVLRSLLLISTFLILRSGYCQSEVYELRIYDIDFSKSEKILHDYLEKAYIPALNRYGIEQVGVFEEFGEALPKKIYLVIPFENIQKYTEVLDLLEKDDEYRDDAEAYWNTLPDNIPFNRFQSSLIRSTSGFANYEKPKSSSSFYELRIYESHNEEALRRKVKMFNDSEFEIFEDVELPMVFFGINISGIQMPSLTYLLAFEDRAAHQEAWAKFGPHPEWQRISKLKEYENAMTDITRVFLKPLAYSQL